MCRTWHCKLRFGGRGHEAWYGAGGDPRSRWSASCRPGVSSTCPTFPARTRPGDFERFYVACADRVDAITDAEAAGSGPRASMMLAELAEASARAGRRMPDVLQPRIQDWIRQPTVTILPAGRRSTGWRRPPWIFELLSRFDGVRPWREAVAETAAALGSRCRSRWCSCCGSGGSWVRRSRYGGTPTATFSILPGE